MQIIGSYPNAKPMDEELLAATSTQFVNTLMEKPWPVGCLGVKLITETSKFLPSLAELREAMARIELGEVQPAHEAWRLVLRIMDASTERVVPRIREVNPIAAEVTRSIGAQTVFAQALMADARDPDRMRREWCELYEKMIAREIRNRSLSPEVRGIVGTPVLSAGPPKAIVSREKEPARKPDKAIEGHR